MFLSEKLNSHMKENENLITISSHHVTRLGIA
jgi:hypothetical protein